MVLSVVYLQIQKGRQGEMLRIQISPVLNSLQAPHKTLQIMLLTSKKKSQKFTLISVSCYS